MALVWDYLLYVMTRSNTLAYSCEWMCMCFYVFVFVLPFVLSDAYWHVSYSDAIDAEIGFVKWICMLCYVMFTYVFLI
jgi:hypothetical protein